MKEPKRLREKTHTQIIGTRERDYDKVETTVNTTNEILIPSNWMLEETPE